MKPILIDASSAILLYKAGLIETMVHAYEVYMAPAVIREVTVPGRSGAEWFLQAAYGGGIKPLVPEGTDCGVPLPVSLDAGERETLIAFGRKRTQFIIMDDGKGVRFCRSHAIPHINALLCPRILLRAGRITWHDYCVFYDYLSQAGRYGRSVLAFARSCSDADLDLFSPCSLEVNRH